MKIDSIIKEFTEKYDDEAIRSIDTLSNEYGLVIHKKTVPAFNANNSLVHFKSFLEAYVNFHLGKMNDIEMSMDEMDQAFSQHMENKVFNEEANTLDILYADVPKFIQGYLEGIQVLTRQIDDWKGKMLTEGVSPETIGHIDGYIDTFTERLNNKFDKFMDKMLWASGYHSNKALFEGKKTERVTTSFV